MEKTLDPRPNQQSKEDGKDNLAVKSALKLVSMNESTKSTQDAKNRLLKKMVNEGFEIQEPNGPRRINVKKLYQVFMKIMQRVRVLDFTIHGTQVPEWKEQIVTAGVATVLERSGYVKMYRDKQGLFQNGFAYGYAFGLFGKRQNGFPFEFKPIDNTNVYIDSRATSMRSGSKPAKKALVVFSMVWADFLQTYGEKYPEIKNKVKCGRIPRDYDDTEQDQSEEQTQDEAEIVEVAHYYDISNMNYTLFAGSNCYVMDEFKDKEYPFTFTNEDLDEEAYLPVVYFGCMPSFEGFYDHGIFDAIYDIAILYTRILNMQSNYTAEGVDPIKFMSVPKGQAGEVFKKMELALQMRAQGKTPFVAIEYDPNSPGSNQVGAQSLQVQSLVNEAQILFDRLDLEIRRFGIQLDDNPDSDRLATAIIAEEESANRFVRQVMEFHASEVQFIVSMVMDQIRKDITPDKIEYLQGENGRPIIDERTGERVINGVKQGDKTPLNMTTKVVAKEDGMQFTINTKGFTLGALAAELKENHYFVKVNSRSGADVSRLKAAQIARVLETTPPGTPAYFDLLAKFAQVNDVDKLPTDFGAPEQSLPQPNPNVEQPQPIASTAPQTINPRQATQTEAI